MKESLLPMKKYLGFDLSTQSLKVMIVTEDLEIVYQDCINFHSDLPEFKTENGIHRHEDGVTVTSPVLMWVKAIDIILMKMLQENIDLSKITRVSGTAQQHGSVYWKKYADVALGHLDHNSSLTDQLQDCFVVVDSPIWLDSSTETECKYLECVAGGSTNLALITGSRAYERFTGNQIAKFYKENRYGYCNCERISLISSFVASIFCGSISPIDFSDGSGMNLLDIRKKEWNDTLLEACAPYLSDRLKDPVPTNSVIGTISQYMIKRYNFASDCEVVAFTGDNPASLIGMRLRDNDVAISLGTSDTLLFWTKEPIALTEGHVFINPVDAEEYMLLLCFKNGSLSRERVCKQYCDGSWDIFNKALKETPPGNFGNIGIYFDEMEILPNTVGVYRWDAKNLPVSEFSSAVECRAIIEGQFMAKKHHAMKFGFKPGKLSRVLATGGASKNIEILKILSNVMNCQVYVLNETSSSACLGSIYNSHLSILSESFKKENDKLEEHTNDRQDVEAEQEGKTQSAEGVTKAVKNESIEPDKMKVVTTTIKDSTEQQQVLRNQAAGSKNHFTPKDIYFEFIKTLPPYELACEPDENSVEIYRKLLERYASLEASLISVDVCE